MGFVEVSQTWYQPPNPILSVSLLHFYCIFFGFRTWSYSKFSATFTFYDWFGFAIVFYEWLFVSLITWDRVSDSAVAKEDEYEDCCFCIFFLHPPMHLNLPPYSPCAALYPKVHGCNCTLYKWHLYIGRSPQFGDLQSAPSEHWPSRNMIATVNILFIGERKLMVVMCSICLYSLVGVVDVHVFVA